ncbi:hypothetical protein RHSIM_Rhsim12G0139100 [Rhododendron simsii]|uniref:peptidylprolyl isomerase n=1 Tax=Rhododendron simsii TaxID=118357 RepID=A0A834G3Y9_RHOSS|nr:hypothetical protein RHSIM_Rhsim12G0139100 [Rhododendron simsii]
MLHFYVPEMATFLRLSPPFLSPQITKTQHFASSQTPPPPPQPPTPPPSQPPSPLPLTQQLSTRTSVEPPSPVASKVQQPQQQRKSTKPAAATSASTSADSTDWIASGLTRRFGLGAGLAWAAFLAFGVVSEQIKTRLEVSQQQANTRDVEKQEEVVLPNGIRYYELTVGGGASPKPGDLVVIDLKGSVEGSTGKVFVDTFGGENRSLALVMGSRPYTRGMCEGIDYVLRSMKAGGKRRVIVPPGLGFGEKGAELGPDLQIPPNAALEYVVQVDRVSIAPA